MWVFFRESPGSLGCRGSIGPLDPLAMVTPLNRCRGAVFFFSASGQSTGNAIIFFWRIKNVIGLVLLGKSEPETHGFLPLNIWGFPVNVPLNQSNENGDFWMPFFLLSQEGHFCGSLSSEGFCRDSLAEAVDVRNTHCLSPQKGYPLVICYIAIENGPLIVDLPSYKMVIFQ